MKACRITFYAGLIYDEHELSYNMPALHTYPDGVYVYYPNHVNPDKWYLRDLTQVLPNDVPANLKLLVLLLG